MKRSYICDAIKFLLACLGFIVFTGLVCGCIINHNYVVAIVFVALDAVYVYMAIKNISIIHIDDEKVEKRTFGKTILSYKWDDIKDAGLANKRFVYFSKDEMTDDDRHRMCFDWPPKDKIYFRAGKKAANTVELLWNRREKLFIRYKSRRFHYF
jgi:hypothetical protein